MAARATMSVAVVGGGIAGIAAAVTLARRGVRVTLFEARRRLGGRAASFTDAASGDTLDNCQHVTLRCCTNYLSLLRSLGVAHLLDWTDAQWWHEPGGRVSVIRPGRLPAPLHYASSFANAAFLSSRDKAAIAAGMTRLASCDPDAIRGRTFASLLDEWDQPASAVARFWQPVVVSACNAPVGDVHAPPAVKVFQDGFLANARAGDVGLSRVPLTRLYDPVADILAATGGELRLGANVDELTPTSVRVGAAAWAFDAVVCALPVERAVRVVAEPWRDARLLALSALIGADEQRSDQREGKGGGAGAVGRAFSPILGVHLWFDRPVLRTPHAVLVGVGTQWLFRKSEAGDAVHAVVSAADGWMELTEAQIVARAVADVSACIPAATGAAVVRARAVKERRATFRCTPALDLARPTTLPSRNARGQQWRGEHGAEPAAGVVLAGDYVASGWPATMEGAARSGFDAAAAVLGEPAGSMVSPDLRRAALALLARRLGGACG